MRQLICLVCNFLLIPCQGKLWTIKSHNAVGTNILLISAAGRVGSTSLLHRFSRNHDAKNGPEFNVIREALKSLPRMSASNSIVERLRQKIRLADDKSTVLHLKFEQHLPKDVSFRDVLQLLRDEFGFGRWVLLQRNPARIDISTQAARRYGWMGKVVGQCQEKHSSYKLSAQSVMQAACRQHKSWLIVHAVKNVTMVGLNYEHDLAAGSHFAYSKIASVFGFEAPTNGKSLRAHCPLASTIKEFKAFQDGLLPSLRFMSDETGERLEYGTFINQMGAGCKAFADAEARDSVGYYYTVARKMAPWLVAVVVVVHGPHLLLSS